MKLCFNAGPEPMEEYFSFAHDNGFPWMELSCNNPNNFLDKWNPERIDGIKRLRDKYGLRYGLHSASFVNAVRFATPSGPSSWNRRPVCSRRSSRAASIPSGSPSRRTSISTRCGWVRRAESSASAADAATPVTS